MTPKPTPNKKVQPRPRNKAKTGKKKPVKVKPVVPMPETEKPGTVEGLNFAQQRFCEEYVYDWNGTRAYQVSYPNASYETAMVNSCVLLRNTKVTSYIELLKGKVAEMAGVSKLKVLAEVCKMAFSNIAHLHNDWIELSEFDKLTPEQKACIESIETKIEVRHQTEFNANEGGLISVPIDVKYVKVRLYDKPKCLEIINKMCGWNAPDKLDASVNMNSKEVLAKKFDGLFDDTLQES